MHLPPRFIELIADHNPLHAHPWRGLGGAFAHRMLAGRMEPLGMCPGGKPQGDAT